jgi:ribosome-associated protein
LGEEVLVLDLRGLCDFTDWFVIAHGTSDRQVVAIADAVEERLESACNRSPRHVEGLRVGEWVLLDYYEFVVHVFLEERRRFFGLERLWGDAPRADLLPEAEPAPAAKAAARRRAPARKRRA